MYNFKPIDPIPLEENYLKMGETNPSGENIYSNNLYLTKNGIPFHPVMGEIHMSRVPRSEWRDRILKMKAAGINLIASYLFWLNHEPEEGNIDFTGENDLAAFVEICKENGLYFCLRIGPYVNAEYRNAGFPDWLMNRDFELRDNNPEYLYYVRRWYQAIYDNIKDYLYKNGGNIIMIQLDNELRNNPEHIKMLKDIAMEIGLTAPIYTATGWDTYKGANLPAAEVLPMFGGYAGKPWTEHIDKIPISVHYSYSKERNSADIGNDLIEDDGIPSSIPLEKYPYAMCELGSGLCVSKHRRPYVSAMDNYAFVLTKLGSGCNLLGYYLFCGGINQIVNGKPVNRSDDMANLEKSRVANIYPMMNNGFQAPIGEHGNITESYRCLKLVNLFVNDFGADLAERQSVFQKPDVKKEDDTNLRYAARVKNGSGYIFVNHHVHLLNLKPVYKVQFQLPGLKPVPEEPIDVVNDDSFFFPINMQYENLVAEYITAQPICRTENTFFFKEIKGVAPIFKFEGEESVRAVVGKDSGFEKDGIKFITLTEEESRFIFKFDGTVYIGDNCDLLIDHGVISSCGFGKCAYYVYDGSDFNYVQKSQPSALAVVSYNEVKSPSVDTKWQKEMFKTLDYDPNRITKYKMIDRNIKYFLIKVSSDNGYVHIDYSGDSAQLYVNGEFVDDHFYHGASWVIPCAYLHGKDVILAIAEYTKDIYVDVPLKGICGIERITVEAD